MYTYKNTYTHTYPLARITYTHTYPPASISTQTRALPSFHFPPPSLFCVCPGGSNRYAGHEKEVNAGM